ncbi:MAG: phosphodiester glycosidase family protein [Bacilli bacterium]|nr:phosphodiester glycosidase family protein [Bacilli bacterium]
MAKKEKEIKTTNKEEKKRKKEEKKVEEKIVKEEETSKEEKVSKEEKKVKEKPVKKKFRLKISFFTILVFLMDLCVIAGLYVIHTEEFKAFWIPSAMTTMTHKYLAYTLYDEDEVNRIMSENYIEQSTEEVNLDDIVINQGDLFTKRYTNKYDKEIFTKTPGNDVYKLIRINESKFKGWLTVIYDPADVELAVSSKLGRAGQSVNTLVRDNKGLVGINGGGFEDLDGWGNGSIPYGAIIKNGQLVWSHSGGWGSLIGFNKDHKMVLTYKKPEEAIADGVMDAVDFGPFLIVNGNVSKIHGDGGWGTAPRTIIAQRKDGVVLFLIIDGRMPGYSIGATMNDVIEILTRYKAYNAANLDGGASTTMSINGSLWNNPYAGGEYGGRTVSNAWIVTNKQGKAVTNPNKNDY